MDTTVCHLYVITNKISKKKYIGVTNNPTNRWEDHQKESLENEKPLYKAMREEGIDNFFFSVLATGPRWVIFELEKALIAQWKTLIPDGYNISPGGPLKFRRRRKKRKKKNE